MSRAAISWGRAAAMLAGHGFSNLAISDIMRAAKRAGTFDGAAYYYPDDIMAEADSYLDGLSIDDCGGE